MSNRERRALPKSADAGAGSRLALTNARRHLRAAEILDESGVRGAATAHVVLSIEELAKALTLTNVALGVDVPKSALREMLTNHDARHSFTMGMLLVAIIRHMGVRASSRVQKRHGVTDYPPELRDEYAAELTKDMDSLWSRSKRTELGFALLEWIAQANDFKNRALYVDFDGKKWIHPARITRTQYDLGYRIAVELIKRLGRMISRVHKYNLKADNAFRELMANELKKRPSSPQDSVADLIRFALNTL